jgi:hypothetical protein
MQISSSTSSSPYQSNYDATSTVKEAPSPVKQFACGALGLDQPESTDTTDTKTTSTNEFYTAGKWVAAAVTIGRIVSLFV